MALYILLYIGSKSSIACQKKLATFYIVYRTFFPQVLQEFGGMPRIAESDVTESDRAHSDCPVCSSRCSSFSMEAVRIRWYSFGCSSVFKRAWGYFLAYFKALKILFRAFDSAFRFMYLCVCKCILVTNTIPVLVQVFNNYVDFFGQFETTMTLLGTMRVIQLVSGSARTPHSSSVLFGVAQRVVSSS